jgi:hypothetical protein
MLGGKHAVLEALIGALSAIIVFITINWFRRKHTVKKYRQISGFIDNIPYAILFFEPLTKKGVTADCHKCSESGQRVVKSSCVDCCKKKIPKRDKYEPDKQAIIKVPFFP